MSLTLFVCMWGYVWKQKYTNQWIFRYKTHVSLESNYKTNLIVWYLSLYLYVIYRYIWEIYIYIGFPGGSDGKEGSWNARDLNMIPGLGRSPWKGNGNPLQFSCMENSMDSGSWRASVCGVTKSQTQISCSFVLICSMPHYTKYYVL